jgi:hypothetical protein
VITTPKKNQKSEIVYYERSFKVNGVGIFKNTK